MLADTAEHHTKKKTDIRVKIHNKTEIVKHKRCERLNSRYPPKTCQKHAVSSGDMQAGVKEESDSGITKENNRQQIISTYSHL